MRWGPGSKSGVGDNEDMRVCETATREGHQIFTNELTRFAQRAGDPRISPLVDELRRPAAGLGSWAGRRGPRTVAAALAAAGVTVADGDAAADVDVVVVAEALKPEDRAMWDPALFVLNKADLAGFGAGGPIAVADRRAAEFGALTGVPTVPMVSLLAVAAPGRRTGRRAARAHRRTRRPDLDRRVPDSRAQPASRRARATAGHPRPVRHRTWCPRAAAGHRRRRATGCAAPAQPDRPRAGGTRRGRRRGPIPAACARRSAG